MTIIVIVVGVLILVYLSVLIGTNMDTEAQRREWKRVANERHKLAMQRQMNRSHLCADCPLRRACLAAALERAEPWGVWGGEILDQGTVIARKRPRGRPRKNAVAA